MARIMFKVLKYVKLMLMNPNFNKTHVRILIATPCLPWPLHEGGRVAQYRTLEALQDSCDFTLLFPAFSKEQEDDADIFSTKLPKVKVRPVRCYEPPMPPPPPPKSTVRAVPASFRTKPRAFATSSVVSASGSVSVMMSPPPPLATCVSQPSSTFQPCSGKVGLPNPRHPAVDWPLKSAIQGMGLPEPVAFGASALWAVEPRDRHRRNVARGRVFMPQTLDRPGPPTQYRKGRRV